MVLGHVGIAYEVTLALNRLALCRPWENGDSGKRDGGQTPKMTPNRIDGFFSSGLDDSSAAYALPMVSFAYSVIGFPPNDSNAPYTARQTVSVRFGHLTHLPVATVTV